MILDDYAKKGYRIGIRPQKDRNNWYWVAGIHIGDDERAKWIDSNNGLPWACYNTYEEAYNACIKYCETKSTKR